MTDRTFELEMRPLGCDWVEVRMVYQTTEPVTKIHQRGLEARAPIAIFALEFAAGFAQSMRAPNLARELRRLADYVEKHSKGHCPQSTRH